MQKSSLRGSVLDRASTARLFLIENNEPNVLHMRGNPKRCCCRARPATGGVGPHVAWGTVLPWSCLLSPLLPPCTLSLGCSRAGHLCSKPLPTPSCTALLLTLISAVGDSALLWGRSFCPRPSPCLTSQALRCASLVHFGLCASLESEEE